MSLFLRRRPRGVAIIIVLLVLMILAVIGTAVATLGSNNLVQASADQDSQMAVYAAEAGARRKMGELRTGNQDPIAATEMPRTPRCTYEVSVTVGPATAPNGVVVDSDTFYLLSTGTSPRQLRRQVGIMVKRSGSAYNFAAFAANKIVMKGLSVTDTYNSTTGLPGNNALAGIGTNSAAAEAVKFEEMAGVRPKIGGVGAAAQIMGPPGSVQGVTVSGASAPGDYASFQAMPTQRTLATVMVPRVIQGVDQKAENGATVTLPPGDYNNVSVETGGRLILDVSALPDNSVGTYCFGQFKMLHTTSRLELNTGGKNITCELYVDNGEFTVEQGAIFNPTQKPGLLQFQITNGNAKVEDSGSAYFVAYVPNGEFKVARAQVYGAITAKDVLVEEGTIHYDEVLANTSSPGFGSLQLISVQRF